MELAHWITSFIEQLQRTTTNRHNSDESCPLTRSVAVCVHATGLVVPRCSRRVSCCYDDVIPWFPRKPLLHCTDDVTTNAEVPGVSVPAAAVAYEHVDLRLTGLIRPIRCRWSPRASGNTESIKC